MQAKLVLLIRGRPSREIKLRKRTTTLGRAKGNDIQIPAAEISRRHCSLTMVDGVLVVEDFGSSNGTFVNRDKVVKEVVRPGDELMVGPVAFRVDYTMPTEDERIGVGADEDERSPVEALADGSAFPVDDDEQYDGEGFEVDIDDIDDASIFDDEEEPVAVTAEADPEDSDSEYEPVSPIEDDAVADDDEFETMTSKDEPAGPLHLSDASEEAAPDAIGGLSTEDDSAGDSALSDFLASLASHSPDDEDEPREKKGKDK